MKRNPLKRREPLTDTMLLVTITIGIFFAMYFWFGFYGYYCEKHGKQKN